MKFEIDKSRNSVQIIKFMQNSDQPLNPEECKYKFNVQLMTNSVWFAHVHLVCNACHGTLRGGAVGKCKSGAFNSASLVTSFEAVMA